MTVETSNTRDLLFNNRMANIKVEDHQFHASCPLFWKGKDAGVWVLELPVGPHAAGQTLVPSCPQLKQSAPGTVVQLSQKNLKERNGWANGKGGQNLAHFP